MTDEERGLLEQRRADLEACLAPYDDQDENDRVALALADMFSGFPSMRLAEVDAAAKIDNTKRVLKEFPAWAIEEACRRIQYRGVERDGKLDRQWAPSDPELFASVMAEVSLRRRMLEQTKEILEAEVDTIDLRRQLRP